MTFVKTAPITGLLRQFGFEVRAADGR
jgi:hypothetical protein